MIKKKISEDVQEIYVEKYPDRIRKKVYRGDLFSHSIIGFNFDDSPFDFSVYDSFKASIRWKEEYTDEDSIYTFTDNEIILGKTDVNSPIFDELHIVSKKAIDLPITGTREDAFFDIEGSFSGEIKSFMKIKLRIETDITR